MRNPDYKRVSILVAQLFSEISPCYLPIDLRKIILKYAVGLRVKSYSWFAKLHGISIDDVIQFTESQEGCCYYLTNKSIHLILYNDKNNIGNQRWTIAHELGHYFLKHNEESKESIVARNSLSTTKYEVYEKEANCFARELLAHPSILWSLNVQTPAEIMKYCHISYTAACNVSSFISNGIEMGRDFSRSNVRQFFRLPRSSARYL